jgi:hypothetical protein
MTAKKQADRIDNLENTTKRMDEQISFLKDMIQLQAKNIESLNALILGSIIQREKESIRHDNDHDKNNQDEKKNIEIHEMHENKDKVDDKSSKKTKSNKSCKHLVLSRRVI